MVGIQLNAKVGEKGQVVIPKPIRQRFNIKPNTNLVFDIEDEKIIVKKRTSLNLFEEFINAVKNKKDLPKNTDWDKEHYSQFDD